MKPETAGVLEDALAGPGLAAENVAAAAENERRPVPQINLPSPTNR
jgi:hypothetical protein